MLFEADERHASFEHTAVLRHGGTVNGVFSACGKRKWGICCGLFSLDECDIMWWFSNGVSVGNDVETSYMG